MYDERVREILGFDPEEANEQIEAIIPYEDRSGLKEIDPIRDIPEKNYDLDFLTYLDRLTKDKRRVEGFYCTPYPDRQFHVEIDRQSEVSRVYSTRQFLGFETESVASFFTYHQGMVEPHFVRLVMNHEDYFKATLNFMPSALYEIVLLDGRPNQEDKGLLVINYHEISHISRPPGDPAVVSNMPPDGGSWDFFRKSEYEQLLMQGRLQTRGSNGNYDFHLEDGTVVMHRFQDGQLVDSVKFNPNPSREYVVQELFHPSILQDPKQPPHRWDYLWATADLPQLLGIEWERH